MSKKNTAVREIFPWADVDAARKNAALQANVDPEHLRVWYGRDVKCPCCGCPGEQLSWFYFSSPPWTWQHLCGRKGYMAVCDKCHVQVEFMCLAVS